MTKIVSPHWSKSVHFACLLGALVIAPLSVIRVFAASPPSQESGQTLEVSVAQSTDQSVAASDPSDQSPSGNSVDQTDGGSPGAQSQSGQQSTDQSSTRNSEDSESSRNSVDKNTPKNFNNLLTTKGGFLTSISRRQGVLGDMWGLRKALSKYGMSLYLFETSEVLGNAAGGVNQGPEYDGLTQMILQLDTQRAFHWYGGTFNVSGLQIHGQNLSALNLGILQTASGIEADRSTRLWELWYDQKSGHEGTFDLKLGQQSLDQEFMVSNNALLFVNTMFGWPWPPSYLLSYQKVPVPLSSPKYSISTQNIGTVTEPNWNPTSNGGSWSLPVLFG